MIEAGLEFISTDCSDVGYFWYYIFSDEDVRAV